MHSLGGVWHPFPLPRKRPQRIGIGWKCKLIAQFCMASSKKKVRPIQFFNSLGAIGRVEKNGQANFKKVFFCFKQISKCDTYCYMHFSKYSFQNQLQSQKIYGLFYIFISQTGQNNYSLDNQIVYNDHSRVLKRKMTRLYSEYISSKYMIPYLGRR